MRIVQLQVTGFKSFMEKTSFSFDVPITGIVGPNGCGKSNVVDALKWVTGELSYKQLRGKSSEDLIFAGSDRRPPSSMMEVMLTLDNSEKLAPAQYNEFSQITVMRRIFRDGSSEFAINKAPCRLRDINDLFLDTGIGQSSYSIIEQGKVGAIVSGRPEDRRLMIEEAAGITKYKHRKKAALRKMDATRQNLLRVTDIIKELEKQIASLERQAKKAEKYKAAKEAFETLDLYLSAFEYQKFNAQKKDQGTWETEIQDQVSTTTTDISKEESEYEAARSALDALEETFASAQQELFSKKSDIQQIQNSIAQCDVSIENSKKQIALDDEKIAARKEELENLQSRAEVLANDIKTTLEKKDMIGQDLSEKQGLFQTHKTALEQLESELEALKSQHIQSITRKTECKSSIESKKETIHAIEKDMGEVSEDLASIADELTERTLQKELQKEAFEKVQQMCFGFQEDRTKLEDQLVNTEQEKMQLEATLKSQESVLQDKQSRLKTLIEFTKTYQGYTKTVQNIMTAQSSREGFRNIQGVLGEMIHIEPGYEKAAQAVLDDWIEGIVVEDIDATSDLVQYLTKEEKSRAMVLVPSTMHAQKTEISDANILGTLDQWVQVSKDSAQNVTPLLQNVNVVASLQDVLSLSKAHPHASFVSLKGDYAQSGGMLHIGPWRETRGDLEVRLEIENVSKELEPLKAEVRETREKKEQVDKTFAQLTKHLEQVEHDIQVENKKSSEMSLALDKLVHEIEMLEKQQAQKFEQKQSQQRRLAQLDEELVSVKTEFLDLQTKIESLETDIEEKTQSANAQKETFALYQEDIHKYQIELTGLLERMESMQREQAQNEQSQRSAREQVARLEEEKTQQQENIEAQINHKQTWEEKLQGQFDAYQVQETQNSELKVKHDEMVLALTQAEGRLKELRRKREDAQEKLHEAKLSLSELALKMENLQHAVMEHHEKDLLDVIADIREQEEPLIVITEETVGEHQQERDALKTKMQRFGNVNLAAIEEIDELKERFEFLTNQRDDLETSITTLTDAIKTINKTTREKFETTYAEVNERFQNIFPRLFRGGKAKLTMTDPDNVLETGLDIFAQPPGKRLQNMNLLSGGEKALTAIALLFAIFEYKAPPFCVLDEVDAPLDDANVLRYVAMVQEMAKKTQFIVITHNKSSMQMANNLYGVTMEEPGVSRTVSVRLDQENVHEEEAIFEEKSVA